MTEKSQFDSRWEQKIFLFFTTPRLAIGSIQPLTQWILVALSLGVKHRGMKLIINHHVLLKLIMCGAIPVPPYIFVVCVVLH
jgi:hypothetical protein